MKSREEREREKSRQWTADIHLTPGTLCPSHLLLRCMIPGQAASPHEEAHHSSSPDICLYRGHVKARWTTWINHYCSCRTHWAGALYHLNVITHQYQPLWFGAEASSRVASWAGFHLPVHALEFNTVHIFFLNYQYWLLLWKHEELEGKREKMETTLYAKNIIWLLPFIQALPLIKKIN